ncbi:MAG: DUF2147 domain-containing protein [Flavobacteriaceae bacterium]|nr:DUF2147 domain-containing protein [Flavobacteriaceae bacterium]
MKKYVITLGLLLFVGMLNAQSIFGKWKTIDDETKQAKSIVKIYEKDGKAYAQIITLLDEAKKGSLCKECSGKNKNQPIEGLVIINGLEKDGDEWNGGKILDPKTGKEYKCYLSLANPNKLKVRGYIGFALLGRTQYWERVE